MPIKDMFKYFFNRNSKKYNVTQVDNSDTSKNNLRNDVSYGLERYKYNAMLLFCQVTSELGNRDRAHARILMTHLIQTLDRHRFTVVESYVDLTGREVEDKCDEFFKCDFSECGAVAIVILAPCGASGSLAARDRPFHENSVLKYLTTHVPETLRSKPKIFITESKCMDIFLKGHSADSFFNVTSYEDIMYLRIPNIIENKDRTPIQIFCEGLNRAEDFANLEEIMKDAVIEMMEEYPLQMKELDLICTFKKHWKIPLGTYKEDKKPSNSDRKFYELSKDGNKEFLI